MNNYSWIKTAQTKPPLNHMVILWDKGWQAMRMGWLNRDHTTQKLQWWVVGPNADAKLKTYAYWCELPEAPTK